MIVGTCSSCGGPMMVPDLWGSVIPPTPKCSVCGAVAAKYGPVIQTVPEQKHESGGSSSDTTEFLLE